MSRERERSAGSQWSVFLDYDSASLTQPAIQCAACSSNSTHSFLTGKLGKHAPHTPRGADPFKKKKAVSYHRQRPWRMQFSPRIHSFCHGDWATLCPAAVIITMETLLNVAWQQSQVCQAGLSFHLMCAEGISERSLSLLTLYWLKATQLQPVIKTLYNFDWFIYLHAKLAMLSFYY